MAAGACYHEGELSPAVTVFTVVATVVGNVVCYRRRERPWRATKPVLAVCAVSGFVWFIATVTNTATPGDISTVEGPLAVLFAWVLSTHAFDVPARRDVAYSLAGSAALMAVAAAQAVDLGFGLWVMAWMACSFACLVAMWQSMSSTRGVPWPTMAGAGVVMAVLTVLLIAVLPPPRPSTALLFPSAGNGQQVTSASQLTDGNASLPAHAATAQGRTGVGGYLGFAKALDLADRASLGNDIVLRVRASRPGYWVGETYDHWDGQNWTQSGDPANGTGLVKLESGSPFSIPPAADQTASGAVGTPDVQTFYLAQSGPNLVFHTDQAERVYIQSKALYLTGDGTIVSSVAMGAGTIYTVVSADSAASAAELRSSTVPRPAGEPPAPALTPKETARYLQLPHPYPQVAALARQITASVATSADGDPHTYDKVAAIEQWMSTNVRYTTDIPPLPAGADAVTSFLFGSRRGYCEQISTATVVMLRTLGIPARETVGYVPGSYDPFTDLYEVEASDAHSWVQVWFPGYGWQNFDPTAQVPLANPSPGSVLTAGAVHLLGRLPWVPLGAAAAAVCVAVLIVGRRRRRPPTWAHRVALDLDRGGRHRGTPRRRTETLTDYGRRLGSLAPDWADGMSWVCGLVERYSYGGVEPSADEIGAALSFARRFAWRGRRPPPAPPPARTGSPPPGPGRDAAASGAGGSQGLVEGGAGSQEWPVGHELARPAEGQRRLEPVAAPVEGDHPALVGRAVDDHHVVVRPGEAEHLDLRVVLVGPEEGHRVVGNGRALGRPGGSWPRRLPPRPRSSSARPARCARPRRVANGPRRRPPPLGRRRRATRRRRRRQRARGPSPRATRLRGRRRSRPRPRRPSRRVPSTNSTVAGAPPPAVTPATPTPVRSRTPWARVERATRRPHLLAEHPGERRGQGLDHRDLGVEASTGGGHLGPDEAGADDDDPGVRPRSPPGGTGWPGSRRGSAGCAPPPSPRCRGGPGPELRWPPPAPRRGGSSPSSKVRVRVSVSRATTRRPSRNSMPRVSSLSGVWWWMRSMPHLPARNCFESGGRS